MAPKPKAAKNKEEKKKVSAKKKQPSFPPSVGVGLLAIAACGAAFVAKQFTPAVPAFGFVPRRTSAEYPKIVWLCRNGEHEGCVQKTLDEEFRTIRGQHFIDKVTAGLPEDFVGDTGKGKPRLFSPRGFLLQTSDEILPNDIVHVLPYDRQFVRATVAIGHRVEVEDIETPNKGEPIIIETLETNPRVFMISNFMNEEEIKNVTAHVLSLDDDRHGMKRSGVGTEEKVERKDGKIGGMVDEVRTSTNAWDVESYSARRIIDRAFKIAGVPHQYNQEDGIQVLHYAKDKAYIPHHDYFTSADASLHPSLPAHNFFPEKGGSNRMATVFLYFADTEEGGGTVFPTLESHYCKTHTCTIENETEFINLETGLRFTTESVKTVTGTTWEEKMTHQCRNRFVVKPKKGSAIIFYSQHPNGTLNPHSLHGGCPVVRGEKWGANLWIWNGPRYIYADKEEMERPGYRYVAAAPPLSKGQPTEHQAFLATFTNHVGMELDLHWVGPDGKEVFIMKLPGGGGANQASANSHHKHKWRARKPDGTLVTEHEMDVRVPKYDVK